MCDISRGNDLILLSLMNSFRRLGSNGDINVEGMSVSLQFFKSKTSVDRDVNPEGGSTMVGLSPRNR